MLETDTQEKENLAPEQAPQRGKQLRWPGRPRYQGQGFDGILRDDCEYTVIRVVPR